MLFFSPLLILRPAQTADISLEREETGLLVKERTNAKLHFLKVSVEKIKCRAQVHQENLKGKFI